MNLENTIWLACATYSSIFPHRAAVLNHLFCANGTGYYWNKIGALAYDGEYEFENISDLRRRASAILQHKKKADRIKKKAEHKRKIEWLKNPPPSDSETDELIKRLTDSLDAFWDKVSKLPASEQKRIRQEKKQEYRATIAKIREDERYRYSIPPDIKQRIKKTEGYHSWYPMSEGYCYLLNFPDNIQANWLGGIIETAELILLQPAQIDSYNTPEIINRIEGIARKSLEKALNIQASRNRNRK